MTIEISSYFDIDDQQSINSRYSYIMISKNIQRRIFWIILAMSVHAEAYGDGEMFYQIKQGICKILLKLNVHDIYIDRIDSCAILPQVIKTLHG